MQSSPPALSPWSADLAAAGRVAQRYAGRRDRRADALLLIELLLHIAVTYAVIFWVTPAWLAAALLLPWSLYSALAVDNILHYLNHWPVFRSGRVNRLVRLLYTPLLLCPLEVRYVHWEHHKYNDIEVDQETWMRSIAERSPRLWVSVLRYILGEVAAGLRGLAPWAELAPHLERLRTSRPRHLREIRAARWLNLLWLGGLLWWQPLRTLCLFIPAVVLVPLVASLLMNLTDHLPSELTHPLRQATYLDPQTLGERLLAAVNRQSGATHLTHHLFPQVHWTQLRALQRELAPIYQRYGAPRSLLHNSLLLGNWLALWRVYLQVARVCRRALPGAG